MSSSAGLLKRGYFLYTWGQFQGSLRAVERYLDAHPRSATAWMLKACVLARLGRVEQARDTCASAQTLAPMSGEMLQLSEAITVHLTATPTQTGTAVGAGSVDLHELLPALYVLAEIVLLS